MAANHVRVQDLASTTVRCPHCGWTGLASATEVDEVFDGVTERTCPSCHGLAVIESHVFVWHDDTPEGRRAQNELLGREPKGWD